MIKAGAEILVATKHATAKEGQKYGNWTVLAKFETEQALNDFYDSEDYEQFKKLRIETLSNGSNFLSIPRAT